MHFIVQYHTLLPPLPQQHCAVPVTIPTTTNTIKPCQQSLTTTTTTTLRFTCYHSYNNKHRQTMPTIATTEGRWNTVLANNDLEIKAHRIRINGSLMGHISRQNHWYSITKDMRSEWIVILSLWNGGKYNYIIISVSQFHQAKREHNEHRKSWNTSEIERKREVNCSSLTSTQQIQVNYI